MRRKDRELSPELALSIADRCGYAVLSLVSKDSLPYAVPVSPARMGGYMYFHCANEGTKTDIMRENPDVCLVCVGNNQPAEDKFTTYFESAIIKGKASEVTDKEEKIAALRVICEKYTPSNMSDFDNAIERSLDRTAVWKISIDEITGKAKTKN